MKLFIAHPITRDNPFTFLAQNYNAGINSFNVKNTNGFIPSKYIVLGSVGFQEAEILLQQIVTVGTSIQTATNSLFNHNEDTKITQIDFNQIHVYKSTSGVGGEYVLDQTLNIDIDSDVTIYEDINSLPNYYYKIAFFNQFTTYEDTQSDPIPATGFQFYSLNTMVTRVLSLFGDADAQANTRDEVTEYLNEIYEWAQQEYKVITKRENFSSQLFTVQLNVTDYALNGDFLVEKAVQVSYDNGQTFPYYATQTNIDNVGHAYSSLAAYSYSVFGNTIRLDPVPQNNSDIVKIYYSTVPLLLANQTDVLQAPFQNQSGWMVKFALGMCYLKDRKVDTWQALTNEAKEGLSNFLSQIKRFQTRHPQQVSIADPSFM